MIRQRSRSNLESDDNETRRQSRDRKRESESGDDVKSKGARSVKKSAERSESERSRRSVQHRKSRSVSVEQVHRERYKFCLVYLVSNGHSPANLSNSSTRQNGHFGKLAGLDTFADIRRHSPTCFGPTRYICRHSPTWLARTRRHLPT